MATDHDSGDYIHPLRTYLDESRFTMLNWAVSSAWKALIYHGAKAHQFARCEILAGAIAAEAAQDRTSGRLSTAAASRRQRQSQGDQDEAPVERSIPWAVGNAARPVRASARRKRLNARAARKQPLLWRRKSQKSAPATMLDALSPTRPRGYTDADQRRLLSKQQRPEAKASAATRLQQEPRR